MPLLLSWPARLPPRAEALRALVSHLDLVPTLLDAANVPPTMRHILPPEPSAAPAAESAADAADVARGGGGGSWGGGAAAGGAAGAVALTLAGGGPSWRHPGRSLAPLLVQAVMKGQVEPEVHTHLYCEVGQMRAVFSTDWRLIYAPQIRPVAKGGSTDVRTNYGVNKHHPAYWRPLQLYNLQRDPTEQSNLINESAVTGTLARLRGLLHSHMSDACREEEWDQ